MSSGFVKESDLEEARRLRQEEWEKVRTAEDPEEAPEEPYDSRSLFERLQEQKMKKDHEFEESRKLKNMIRGLDDDEVEYLDYVDQRKISEERKKIQEEKNELKEFREQVATLQQKSMEDKLQLELGKPKSKSKLKVETSNRLSQKAILSNVIKRKTVETPTDESETPPKKIQTEEDNSSNNPVLEVKTPSALKCVAILPGLGSYNSSDDSDDSSDSDSEERSPNVDWIGRKLKKKSCNDADDDD